MVNQDKIIRLFYIPWLIKPVYGYLGDYFFPFYYRVKGYVLLFALIALGSTTTMLVLVPSVYSGKLSKDFMLAGECINFFALAFIDAVCRSDK